MSRLDARRVRHHHRPIEHDMSVVMDISDRVVVLDYGRKIADGPPEIVRKDQVVMDAYLGVAHD